MVEEAKSTLEEYVVDVKIKSGVVGIYRNPPEVGRAVKEGDSLGHIEQLGIKHELESRFDGVVESCLGDNTAVEYGQSILRIKPQGYSLRKDFVEKNSLEDLPENCYVVRAFFNSVFYTTPTPNDPPYVNVGDEVEKSTTLCLLEAQKCYNEIHLDDLPDFHDLGKERGKILKVCKPNGSEVQKDEWLFLVELLD